MTIHLSTDAIDVEVTPERGADITRLIDRSTGINVFAESPTGNVANSQSAWSDSMTHWINGYPGGWQILVPNAGPEREWDGVSQGFHGEASLASWAVLGQTSNECELETSLLTAPLHLHRTVTAEGSSLTVTDRITNSSPRETSFRLCQHPAFGHHFLDAQSYLSTTAGKFIADADNPGSLSEPNAIGAPTDVLAAGPLPNTVALPGPGSEESLFGALTDFGPANEGGTQVSVTFVSPGKKLSATVTWDAAIFPYAWFWIEANATPTWPWFQRLYSVAVEPANILPGTGAGPQEYPRGGAGTTLGAGHTLTSQISITIEPHTTDDQN